MKPTLIYLILFLGINEFLYTQDTIISSPPNIVLIVVDDMGWKDVGYHGSEIRTPTMDRLATSGVELNRFYVHPACSPTRSSLMTGKAAVRLGFVNPLGKNNVKGLPLSEKIMPQYFKENGYATNLIGKWHLGRFKKEHWPTNRGFDHFYGYLNGGIGHYDHVHGGGLDWQRNGTNLEEEGYVTHLLTNEAVKIIQAKGDQPLFIELCYAAPHLPNEAPDESVADYKNLDNINRQLHAAMVTEVDKGIQIIYDALEEKGLLENTIIWFMSDNGGINMEATPKEVVDPIMNMTKRWGEPLPFPFLEFLRDNIVNGAGDNSPLKGGKNTVYEGGLRVPSFIYAPNILAQQTINHRITVNDILPTLATATGFKSFETKDVDGVSQWNYLKQESAPLSNTFVSVARFRQAYYKDEWKLVLPNEGEGEPELYKLDEDPNEERNLSDQNLEIVETLRDELLAFPRGESVDDPLWKVFLSTDKFGGEIDRAPYAGKEGNINGPLHKSFYILGIAVFTIFILLVWLLQKLIFLLLKIKNK